MAEGMKELIWRPRSRVEALLASDRNDGVFLVTGISWTSRLAGSGGRRTSIYPMGASRPYQILREIGHGGMGTVYLAEQRGRPVS